jgi:HlyD family secretion protein
LPYIEFSSKLLKDAEKYEVAKILETQKNVFHSRKALLENEEKLTMQRIKQNEKQIEAMKEKKVAMAKTREVLEERLKSNKTLFEKGVISKAAMAQIEKEYTDAKSNDLATDSEIIRTEQETLNLQTQLEAKKAEFFSRALEELKRTQIQLADAIQKHIQTKESLDRIIVRAPVDGTIIKVEPATIGGVIGQGSPLAELSPENDNLIIEAKIAPKDIGYITPGMDATVRFQAFKSRTTPSFPGKVVSLSPDVVIDPRRPDGDNAYYIARVEVDKDEFEKDAKRLKLKLLPGMQADVLVRRGTRTLLRYLLDPITDNMFNAFKEK